MNTPLISIITVVYNGEKTLEKTIKSVIDQTYKNIEYIIIDGASSDSTVEIIKKYEDEISYWISEEDNGIFDAINKALKVGKGKYYLVLGADDYLYTDGINQVVKQHLNDDSIDFVIASVDVGKTRRCGYFPNKHWLGASFVVTEHSVGMFIKSTLHQEVGYYNLLFPQTADAFFIKQLLNLNKKGVASDVVTGRFSLNGISNTNVSRGLCEGFLIQIETEKYVLLQLILFILRLLKNFFHLKNR